jgi:hypothetical protein
VKFGAISAAVGLSRVVLFAAAVDTSYASQMAAADDARHLGDQSLATTRPPSSYRRTDLQERGA